jgi:hypothetical protein
MCCIIENKAVLSSPSLVSSLLHYMRIDELSVSLPSAATSWRDERLEIKDVVLAGAGVKVLIRSLYCLQVATEGLFSRVR